MLLPRGTLCNLHNTVKHSFAYVCMRSCSRNSSFNRLMITKKYETDTLRIYFSSPPRKFIYTTSITIMLTFSFRKRVKNTGIDTNDSRDNSLMNTKWLFPVNIFPIFLAISLVIDAS